MRPIRFLNAGVLALLLVGCTQPSGQGAPVPGRWYSQAQVDRGERLFETHCAGCHGPKAVGAADWKRRGPDGKLPPPPLDGSAHAWHHDLPLLMKIITEGGAAYGGAMPSFKGQLDDDQKRSVIAYFQSLWNDEIYSAWNNR